jgi:hypothetical protein
MESSKANTLWCFWCDDPFITSLMTGMAGTLLRYYLDYHLTHFRHIVTSFGFLVSNNKDLDN